MARINTVRAGHARPSVKITYWFTRRHLARLTGRDPELKAATRIHCAFCIDLASQISRRSGLSDENLLALPAYRTSGLALEDLRARFNVALGIGAAGFSEGRACARPVPAGEIA